ITGPAHLNHVKSIYEKLGVRAQVHSFFSAMEVAMAAATLAIIRAGASSLSELAAMRTPAILIPYPAATDNHQFWNAHGMVSTGAGVCLEERSTDSNSFAKQVLSLLRDDPARNRISAQLAAWHRPTAAADIAAQLLRSISIRASGKKDTREK